MFSYKIFYNFQFYIWDYGSLQVSHCVWCALMVNIYVLFYIGIQVTWHYLLKKLLFPCWHSCHKTIDYLLGGPFLDSISCFINHKKENNITHKITTHISSLLTSLAYILLIFIIFFFLQFKQTVYSLPLSQISHNKYFLCEYKSFEISLSWLHWLFSKLSSVTYLLAVCLC